MRPGGLIAYLMTPLSVDGGRVRLELLAPYVDRVIESCKLDGIACLANDFAYLSGEERRAVAAEVLRCVGGRVPVHVCTTAVSTLHAIEFSKHAEELGAERVIINPHGYMPVSDGQILKHYEVIARSLRIPIHVYNNPVATKVNMSVALLRRIVDATGARSMKEAGSNLEKFQELRAEFGEQVVLHVGFHYMALGGFALGATAWDVGLVPSIAIQCERLYRTAVLDKDFEEAQRLFFTLVPLFQFFRERGALPSLKALAAMEGLDLGGIRAPVAPLAPQEIAELQRRLERARQFGGMGRAA